MIDPQKADPEEAKPERRTDSDVPEPPLYALFGKFRLIARLGKGGMGEVFLAVVSGLKGVNKLVVVKRLRESFGDDKQMRILFLEEGRLAARLNHPNVVQTIDVGEENGALYLGMEYLEGQSLNELRRKLGSTPVERHVVARIVSDALTGLHYAHELADYDGSPLNIVHRDLSPHNIFITYDGVVKLLDFGIAKATIQSDHTDPGIFKGKIAYMAPEQVTANSFDRRADIFVAGIVLWELLAGRRLFAAEAVGQTMGQGIDRLLKMPIPRLSSIVPDMPLELDQIVARALERKLERRYATAKEMRDALETYIGKSGKLARPEDLGQLMTKLFAHRRGRVRERIRQYMNAADTVHSTVDLPLLAPIRKEGDTGAGSVSALSEVEAPGAPPSRSLVRVAKGPSRFDLGLAGALLAMVAVAGLFAGLLTRRPATNPSSSSVDTSEGVRAARTQTSEPVQPQAVQPAAVQPGQPDSTTPFAAPSVSSAPLSARTPARARSTDAHALGTAATEAPRARPASPETDEHPPAAKPDEGSDTSTAAANKRKFRTTF